MLQMRKARATEAEQLAALSKLAFDDDVNYGAPGEGGPPGYDSADWQRRMMGMGDYWSLRMDGDLIGGVIVFPQEAGAYYLGRIFIAPAFQNRGLGQQAFGLIDREYPFARRWTLGTPRWNQRTRHFYQTVGYTEIGEDGEEGVLFERRLAAP